MLLGLLLAIRQWLVVSASPHAFMHHGVAPSSALCCDAIAHDFDYDEWPDDA